MESGKHLSLAFIRPPEDAAGSETNVTHPETVLAAAYFKNSILTFLPYKAMNHLNINGQTCISITTKPITR